MMTEIVVISHTHTLLPFLFVNKKSVHSCKGANHDFSEPKNTLKEEEESLTTFLITKEGSIKSWTPICYQPSFLHFECLLTSGILPGLHKFAMIF
jgi:hypothetical protein